jgi:hypothetical protein
LPAETSGPPAVVNSAACSVIEPEPPTFVVRIEKVTVVDPVNAAKATPAVRTVGVETVMLASAATVAVTVVDPVRTT